MGVNKQNNTLSSITTIVIVMVIAIVILLVGNYAKNLNSGIALEHQILNSTTRVVNNNNTDKIEIADSEDNLILSIISTAQASAGYDIELKKILYRGSDINISYLITQPEPDKMYADVITYPSLSIQLEKNSLPIGASLNFNFYNLTAKTKQTIPYTIKI